jgi:hypothetical protein
MLFVYYISNYTTYATNEKHEVEYNTYNRAQNIPYTK